VLEQERRHEVALLERLQHVDGVEHGGLVGVGELLDERLHRRGIGHRGPHGARLDAADADAVAERPEVLPPCDEGRHHPDGHQRQTGVTQPPPVEAETPRLDQHERHDGRGGFGDTVSGDVDEGLGAGT
jgi:hypothetical protein